MRFVQFYFGLPLAMVILSATAVPIFHRARVYTAYEYLEQRFDMKTRALVSVVFLIQRGLAAGLALFAPAVLLSVVLGWPDYITTIIMGVLIAIYTTTGGLKALTWADVQQMVVILAALVVSLILAFHLMPKGISVLDALHLAGAARKLNPVDFRFDLTDSYTAWSGLIGGMFLALAYFGVRSEPGTKIPCGKIHCPKPAGSAVQRCRQNPDAGVHPVHRRDGVCSVSFREASGNFPACRGGPRCAVAGLDTSRKAI